MSNTVDERLDEIEEDPKDVVSPQNGKTIEDLENDINTTYDGLINDVDSVFQSQIDASNALADEQKKLQQEQTDFAIEQINQQKNQAEKDYIKEQSAAYTDYKEQTAQHGVNAEQMAALGMRGTGYSESSMVRMYNAYQNRVAVARESYNQAVLNYDNAIKAATLQNSSALAQIALDAFQTQLELTLKGFQYKNSLIIEKENKIRDINNGYLDVLSQLGIEKDSEGTGEVVYPDDFIGPIPPEEIEKDSEDTGEVTGEDTGEVVYPEYTEDFIGPIPPEVTFSKIFATEKMIEEYLSSDELSPVQKYAIKYAGNREFTSYRDAVDFLNEAGVEGDGGLMTKSEWTTRKNKGSQAAEMAYDTYSEYLKAIVVYKIANSEIKVSGLSEIYPFLPPLLQGQSGNTESNSETKAPAFSGLLGIDPFLPPLLQGQSGNTESNSETKAPVVSGLLGLDPQASIKVGPIGNNSIEEQRMKEVAYINSIDITSHSKAVSILDNYKLSKDGLMKENEWIKAKKAGSNEPGVKANTYQDYLKNFIIWRINNP